MKKWLCLLLALLLPGAALADRTVQLPNSRYVIEIPDYMRYSEPGEDDSGVYAYYCEILEMDYTSYRKEDAMAQGMPGTLREAAENRVAGGAEVELREINGIEMLCFRTADDADGAPCIGYVFEDEGWMVEVDFWYANEEAARLTGGIISTIH